MRVPESLATLAEFGVIEDVLRPLMSGKEAQVFLVVSGGKECIAKVYKKAEARAFKNRAEYTEGRGTRNTRDQRAMGKRTGYGREKNEEAWHSTEVDMLRLLHGAGVSVPTPMKYMDGVLVMEMITDAEGEPAPRLGEVELPPAEATAVYEQLLRQVVRMLCAGVVHGDLSEFNVLLGTAGPVIIDLPQAINASKNPHARKLLVRDVENLHRFLKRLVPGAKIKRYAEEMWDLYEKDELTPETPLAGNYVASEARANTAAVLDMIEDAEYDEARRRENLGLPASRKRAHGGSHAKSSRHGGSRPQSSHAPAAARSGAGAPGSKQRVAEMMRAVEKGGPAALKPAPKAAHHAPPARSHHAPRPRPHEGDAPVHPKNENAKSPGGGGVPSRRRRRRR